jgi:hypothetical protein
VVFVVELELPQATAHPDKASATVATIADLK